MTKPPKTARRVHKRALNPFKDHISRWGWIMENLRNTYALVNEYEEDSSGEAVHLTKVDLNDAIEDWKAVKRER